MSGAEFTQRSAFNAGRLLAALARHEAATTPRHKNGRVTLIADAPAIEELPVGVGHPEKPPRAVAGSHAVLLEHMKPDAGREIYQTRVSIAETDTNV